MSLGMLIADSEETKTIRPQLRFSMPGIRARDSRTPERTLTSKKRRQSSSGMAKKSLGSKMPALLTRISASGTAAASLAQPSAVETSAATPRSLAFGERRLDLGQRRIDRFLLAAVDGDPGAAGGQAAGDREADAAGRAGDEGGLAGEVDVHGGDPWLAGGDAPRHGVGEPGCKCREAAFRSPPSSPRKRGSRASGRVLSLGPGFPAFAGMTRREWRLIPSGRLYKCSRSTSSMDRPRWARPSSISSARLGVPTRLATARGSRASVASARASSQSPGS